MVAAAPIVTVEVFKKPVPLIFTAVAPVVGPTAGSILVTVGGATYVNSVASPDLPNSSLTANLALPADPAGVLP